VKINGKKVEASVQKQKGKWMWQLANAVQGENEFELEIPKEKGISDWKGKIEVWNFEYKEHEEKALTIIPVKQVNLKPLPPKPWSDGIYKKTHKLGEINFD